MNFLKDKRFRLAGVGATVFVFLVLFFVVFFAGWFFVGDNLPPYLSKELKEDSKELIIGKDGSFNVREVRIPRGSDFSLHVVNRSGKPQVVNFVQLIGKHTPIVSRKAIESGSETVERIKNDKDFYKVIPFPENFVVSCPTCTGKIQQVEIILAK